MVTARHGCAEMSGRFRDVCTDAAPASSQINSPSAASPPIDAARRPSESRHPIGSPSSESTRSGEMALTPGGALSSNSSSADASAACSPPLARTAARSALSSAKSA